MANNTGLQFDPLAGLGQQSVPTTADEYYIPQVPTLTIPEWKPEQLQKAQNFVNWSINTPQSEKDLLFDPLKSLHKWEQGLRGLDKDELDLWERENAAKTEGQLEAWKERLWKNQKFVDAFGMEAFQATPDKNDRDEMYRDYLLGTGIRNKFGDNSNLDQLLNLTPEGKEELLKSDYQSDVQLKQENKDAEDNDWFDYSLADRWNAFTSKAVSEGQTGMGIGSVVGAAAGTPLLGMGAFAGSLVGAAMGGAAGMLSGALSGIVHPEDADELNAVKRKLDNDDILNKITVADNERKKEQSQDEINDRWSKYLIAFNRGQITEDEVNQMFDNIALSGKRTATDELGNTEQYDYQGSNYYTAFRNSDEFAHFDTNEKLKYIAQTEVLGNKYGQGSALAALEQDMQNYVNENQTGWTWAGNTLKNVWVGGLANLGMTHTALGALGARLFYGEEGLANYLKGKDASGDGSDNWKINNPLYWNKVDQYNDLGVTWFGMDDNYANAEENGGLSTSTNVVKAGEENDFWSWNTLNESLKMSKFAWSDLLKNLALGKLVRGATRVAGGVELAPGVLATESTGLAKGVNTLGSFGVLNASSLGIDAAYGMQTYEEVLRKNNERLDAIIQKDTDAEVQKRIQTPQAQMEFKAFVDAENERRQQMAGETGKWIPVDEAEAWKDYIAYTEKQVREEQEALHAEDRQQAENDAANAYMVDASIEHVRMATTNGAFKSYLFDKGTLNALRMNNPYVATTTKNGLYALGKHATRNKALATLGTNVWGGFHSNYFDDVTVGFAEGFGIQDYNNYLLQKYNPAAYGSVVDDYVNPYLAGITGMQNSMTEKRSFLDGAIGAIGAGLTLMPNVQGMMSHKERMKEASEAAKKRGQESNGISWQEIASDFINNPILQAVADAKAATRMTEAEIKRVNDIIKDNGYSLDNIVETATALNQTAIAKEGTSVMEAEDAKDREAFALASSLLALKNSGVVANAQAEPNRANWSMKQKAAKAIGNGLNQLMGVQMFDEAESSYTKAIQSLQDAATIGESDDAETQARQEQLVETFLGLDSNKGVLNTMSQDEQIAFAQERLKKNASSLLGIMDKAESLQQKFEKSIQANLHPDLKQQLMYQYVMDSRWKDRLSELEQQITGEENPKLNTGTNIIAKYGSVKGYERVRNAQEKRVEQAQAAYDKAKTEAEKQNDPTKSIVENARIKAVRLFKEKTAKANLNKQKAELDNIQRQETTVKQIMENNPETVKANDILRLNADDRLRMLDDFYRNDYSQEQQAEIDKAKNLLMEDGTSINEAMEKVRDAAILNHRIEDNMEVAKRIMQNPVEANQMQQALVENRRRAVIDYFNDKVVAEAFNDFTADPVSTTSQENIQNKANGYSTAVLNGMLKAIEQEIKHPSKGGYGPSVSTLSNMEDGIKAVLAQRDQKLKETAELDKFVRKTKKVNHTEEVLDAIGVASETDRDIHYNIASHLETTERELTPNDRKLLDYAMDFAAERGVPVEEIVEKSGSEDFEKYIQERNHAYQLTANPLTGEAVETNVATVENQANPVSPEYMKGLLSDVLNAYQVNKDQIQKATAAKETTAKPESVATKPVETKGSVREVNDEVRPDEVDPSDPFGLKKKKTQQQTNSPYKVGDKVNYASLQWEVTKINPDGTIEMKSTTSDMTARLTSDELISEQKPAKQEKETGRNAQILDDALVLNQSLLEDVGVLLEELDKMKMDDRTREKLKDIISSNLNAKAFTGIKSLQNTMLADALIANAAEAPGISAKATGLANLDIADLRTRKANKDGITVQKETGENNRSNNPLTPTTTPLTPTPAILETRDLDALINYPGWSDYIKGHNIVGFLQKLADLWNKEFADWTNTGKQGYLHQSQVVFIYDPALAEIAKQGIEDKGGYYNPEISAPVIMALEITDKNKSLVDDEGQLVTIKDKADGKTKQYQIIGFMPSSEVSTADSQTMRATADRMGALRGRINFNDKDAHVLRYAPQNNTGKYNGTIIRTNIEKISSHTEEDRIPHATEDTPKTSVQQLMDENLQSTIESFVNATEEEKQAYENAKESGNQQALRKTSLYKKLRKAFIDRLIKKERKSSDPDAPAAKEMDFKLQKGTSDTYHKIVLVKKIGETLDKNSGRPIIDVLKEVDAEGSNAKEVIESNSRFKRLFNQLSKLVVDKSLFNAEGGVTNSVLYNKAIHELEENIKKIIDNNLHVDDIAVRVDFSEGIPSEKNINIHVYSGDVNNADNLLSTLTTKYRGSISQPEFALFLKDLILDQEGNTRNGLSDSRFERVKWQVNYEDVTTANQKAQSDLEKTTRDKARENLENLYDDGVFEMQVTKLAYPSRSITAGINPVMKSRLYPERTAKTPAPEVTVTEKGTAFEAEGPAGKIDSDTGAATEAPTRESIVNAVPRLILDTIKKMIADSESRILSDDGRHYNILGQIWSRVTSIKYAMDQMGDRFDPNSPWATPSSKLGNSVDEFGRDVLNGVYDNLTDEERKAAFEGYDNSTANNYANVYMQLKAFEARLAGLGQVVVRTGNKENPGKITAKGELNVTVEGKSGIETKKVRVAGTLDVLAIDKNGNLHIYDFKTKHNAILSKEQAESPSKGYDRQLSMYAKFLEDEYGLKVASINIIPIRVEYPEPKSNTDYKEARPGSNQLLKKNGKGEYEEFNAANFSLGKEFNLDRLSDEQLIVSFDKMTDAEKEAIVEAIQDQSETPSNEITKTEEIVDSKPEIAQEENSDEEEEGGRSRKGRLGRRSNRTTDTSAEATAQAINPNDDAGLLARLKDLEKACGGKKT